MKIVRNCTQELCPFDGYVSKRYKGNDFLVHPSMCWFSIDDDGEINSFGSKPVFDDGIWIPADEYTHIGEVLFTYNNDYDYAYDELPVYLDASTSLQYIK